MLAPSKTLFTSSQQSVKTKHMWWSNAKSLQGVLYAMKNRCSTFWPCNTPFSLWSKGYPANSCLVVHWEELCTWPEKTSGTYCTYLQHMLQVQLKWGLGIFINLFFLFSFSSSFSPIWTCAIKDASFDPSFILIHTIWSCASYPM